MPCELVQMRCFSYICSVNCFKRRPSCTSFFCVLRSIVKTFLPTRSYRRETSAKNASPLMKIESFSIQNYKCIKDLAVDCRGADGEIKQWTVLLGENNTGKTNVLRALSYLVVSKFDFRTEIGEGRVVVGEGTTFAARGNEASFVKGKQYVKSILSNGDHWNSDSSIECAKGTVSYLDLFPYGVNRVPARVALSERESLPHKTLFMSDARLLDLQEWLLQLDYSQKSGSEKSQKRLEKMHDLVRSDLFPGVTDFSFKKDGDNEHIVVVFSAGKDGDVRFEELGFGYQTTLTWLADFCKRMFELYPDAENPLHEEAVVLVDELDLHLHPKWQRDLVPTLSKIFPNVQFIVTTHSPHVLQSMEDVNLYVLRRNAESGEIEAERSNVTNFTGWTVEEILGVTMELGDDVLSVAYNAVKKDFEEALRNKDRAAAQRYYERLDDMMRPGNSMRSIYRIRLEEMA